jgi:hypothetical protein
MNNHELQIQIGEHLSNGIIQLTQKIDNMLMALCNLEMKVDYIYEKVENIQTIYNYKNQNNTNTNTNTFDTDTKRKISDARKEKDLQRLLDKEKKLWEKEYLEQDRILSEARQQWESEEKDKQMKLDEIKFSYLS